MHAAPKCVSLHILESVAIYSLQNTICVILRQLSYNIIQPKMYTLQPVFKKSLNYPEFITPNRRCSYNDVHKKQNNKGSWIWYSPPEQSAPVQFCLDTSLHGLKYLGQPERHIFERIFWLAAILASTFTAVYLIWGIWNDYQTTPIITVFNPEEKSLDTIPFPAVTICSVNAISNSTYEGALKYFKTINN